MKKSFVWMITKKMTTFCSDTPLIWFKEEELQDTRGRGVGTSPLFSHHAWDDLIMKKLWDLALLGTCYVIQLPLSCFGCRFAASRNSCFEITSVVSQFSLPTPPLPSPPLSVHVPVKQTPDIVKVCPRNKIRKLVKYVLPSVLLLHFYNVWKSFNLNFCFLLKNSYRNNVNW